MIKNLYDQMDRYLRIQVLVLDYKTKDKEEHWELLNACRDRNVELAVTLLGAPYQGSWNDARPVSAT